MNCLIDYIGLTGCGASNPASGLFINSLPGISLKSIEQLADSEQQTYVGVWNDVQLRATKRLQLNLNAALSKQHKIKTAQYSIQTTIDDHQETSAQPVYPAYLIKSNCWSPLQYHYIQSVTIRKFNTDDVFTITVFNADTNEQLSQYIFTGNGVDEVETFPINANFSNQNIVVMVDCTNGTFFDDSFTDIYFDGGSIQSGIYNNFTFTNGHYAYGIRLTYGLRCSLDNIACHSKDLFALPLWYLLGSELMMERMVSERINKWTVDRKQAEELKAFYDNEADKALTQAIAGANINDCDCCIECDPPIAIREAIL